MPLSNDTFGVECANLLQAQGHFQASFPFEANDDEWFSTHGIKRKSGLNLGNKCVVLAVNYIQYKIVFAT